MLLAVLLLTPPLGLLTYCQYIVNHFETGIAMQVPHLEWLPAEADDVTYYDSWPNKFAEFSIPKDAFEKWCRLQGRELKVLSSEDKKGRIERPRSHLEREGLLEKIPEPTNGRLSDYETYYENYYKEFGPEDLYFEHVQANNGGYWIGYDIEEGRAYFQYAHH